MIQGNKACSIGPAQGEHPEPVEEPAAAMVMDPGKKLDAPGTIPVINGCIHYEHLLSLLIRQRFEEGLSGPEIPTNVANCCVERIEAGRPHPFPSGLCRSCEHPCKCSYQGKQVEKPS